MSDPTSPRSDAASSSPSGPAGHEEFADVSREEIQSALFAQLVMQQSSMAMLLLGKSPHPQTGQVMHDLEGARLFIDELEMLEVKTRGNLTKEEQALLKQTLMALRLAFVEAVEAPAPAPNALGKSETAAAPKAAAADNENKTAPAAPASAAEEESRKRFTKKY